MFCTFWLRNVLRATTVCTFRHHNFQKWCEHGVLYILTSKCASRHNCVQFFISHLARWLSTRRLSEPTFRPSGATNHWKNTVFRDFPTFSCTWIFFLLTLSLLWSSLFYSPLLSASPLLCFSSVHVVGSLTSKLPSINIECIYINIYIYIECIYIYILNIHIYNVYIDIFIYCKCFYIMYIFNVYLYNVYIKCRYIYIYLNDVKNIYKNIYTIYFYSIYVMYICNHVFTNSVKIVYMFNCMYI